MSSFSLDLYRTLQGAFADAGILAPVVRTSAYLPSTTVYGACGATCGQATFDMNINEKTGEFAGTMHLSGYRNELFEDPATGKVLYSGILNPVNGSMNLDMQFQDYQLKGVVTRILVGSMTMGIAADGTGTLKMTVTVSDGLKTYAWKNFTSVVKQVGSHWEVTFTGSFYDHDYGFVDITTPSPILEDANYKVYGGQMRFVGQNNSWATLTFSAQGYTGATSGTGNPGGQPDTGAAGPVFLSAKITGSGQTLTPPIDLKAHPNFVVEFQVRKTNRTNVELRQINPLGTISCATSIGSAGGMFRSVLIFLQRHQYDWREGVALRDPVRHEEHAVPSRLQLRSATDRPRLYDQSTAGNEGNPKVRDSECSSLTGKGHSLTSEHRAPRHRRGVRVR